jgi:hypothetical protein
MPIGDPHNDQMAARARDDLEQHITSTRKLLREAATEGADEVYALAVIAQGLIDAHDAMPRDRLASLLASAMVELAGPVPTDE